MCSGEKQDFNSSFSLLFSLVPPVQKVELERGDRSGAKKILNKGIELCEATHAKYGMDVEEEDGGLCFG